MVDQTENTIHWAKILSNHGIVLTGLPSKISTSSRSVSVGERVGFEFGGRIKNGIVVEKEQALNTLYHGPKCKVLIKFIINKGTVQQREQIWVDPENLVPPYFDLSIDEKQDSLSYFSPSPSAHSKLEKKKARSQECLQEMEKNDAYSKVIQDRLNCYQTQMNLLEQLLSPLDRDALIESNAIQLAPKPLEIFKETAPSLIMKFLENKIPFHVRLESPIPEELQDRIRLEVSQRGPDLTLVDHFFTPTHARPRQWPTIPLELCRKMDERFLTLVGELCDLRGDSIPGSSQKMVEARFSKVGLLKILKTLENERKEMRDYSADLNSSRNILMEEIAKLDEEILSFFERYQKLNELVATQIQKNGDQGDFRSQIMQNFMKKIHVSKLNLAEIEAAIKEKPDSTLHLHSIAIVNSGHDLTLQDLDEELALRALSEQIFFKKFPNSLMG